MNIEQAWAAVLAIQDDIAAIVSQAVRAGRVRTDYTTNDGISYCVELLVSTQELILDAGRYSLASLRRELRYDDKAVTDALDRGTVDVDAVPERVLGEKTANRAISAATANPNFENSAKVQHGQLERVARLAEAGNGIPAIARRLGMQPHRVRTLLGIAAGQAKKRRMEKTQSRLESTD